MTTSKTEALAEAIHEVADIAVNFGGYADGEAESNERSKKRDELEAAIHAKVNEVTGR